MQKIQNQFEQIKKVLFMGEMRLLNVKNADIIHHNELVR